MDQVEETVAEKFPLSLPPELQLAIWGLLDLTSLCTAALVCRAWRTLSSDNNLWRDFCRRELTSVAWTPRALARRHKSWKRHFGVRLRAAAGPRRVVRELLKEARTRACPFVETVELDIHLAYRPKRQGRFVITLVLPHAIRAAANWPKVGLMACAEQTELRKQADALGVPFFDVKTLQSFNKDRKRIKKWARPFACFLAHESFIRMVPRLLGPQLNRQRKFPRLLPSGAPLDQTVNDLHRTVRVVEPKVPSLHCAVGNVGMSVEQLAENVNALLTALAANLPQGLDSVGSAQLHATKGSSFTVYRTPSTRMVTHSERKEE